MENGEVATRIGVILQESTIKGSATTVQYETITFADGSTIFMKVQTTNEATVAGQQASRGTREIIKGTGRFEGIKGTGTGASKFSPIEKGEVTPKSIGELILTYTLPPK